MAKISVTEFEEQVFELEEVRVVVRAPRSKQVDAYDYDRKAGRNQQCNEWLETRVKPKVGDHEVVIVSGDGKSPHGRTKMDTLRDTYAH